MAMIDQNDLFIDDESDVAGQEEISASAKVKDQEDIAKESHQQGYHQQGLITRKGILCKESIDSQAEIHEGHNVFVYGTIEFIVSHSVIQVTEQGNIIDDYEYGHTLLLLDIEDWNLYFQIRFRISRTWVDIVEFLIGTSSKIVFPADEVITFNYSAVTETA